METLANTGCPLLAAWPDEESFSVWEGLAAYQVVGGVTAHQAYDG